MLRFAINIVFEIVEITNVILFLFPLYTFISFLFFFLSVFLFLFYSFFTRADTTFSDQKEGGRAIQSPEEKHNKGDIVWWEDTLGITPPRNKKEWFKRFLVILLTSWTAIGWILYGCFNAAGREMPHIAGWFEVSCSQPESIITGLVISSTWPFSLLYHMKRRSKLSSNNVYIHESHLWMSYSKCLILLTFLNVVLLHVGKFWIHARNDADSKYLQVESLGLVIFDSIWTIIAWTVGSLSYFHSHLLWVQLSLNGYEDAHAFCKSYNFVEDLNSQGGARRTTRCIHSFQVLESKYEKLGNDLEQVSQEYQGWLATLFFVAIILLLSFLLELSYGDPNGIIGIRSLYLISVVSPVIWSSVAAIWPTMALQRIQYTLPKLNSRTDVRFYLLHCKGFLNSLIYIYIICLSTFLFSRFLTYVIFVLNLTGACLSMGHIMLRRI